MSLNGVSVIAGALVASVAGGNAIGVPVSAEGVRSVKNISAKYDFSNIVVPPPVSFVGQTPVHTGQTTPYNSIVEVNNCLGTWRMFDGKTNEGATDMQSTLNNNWEWNYGFDTPTTIDRITLVSDGMTLRSAPSAFTIKGSFDGTTWFDLGSFTHTWASYQTKSFTLSNTAQYKYYKFLTTLSQVSTKRIAMRECILEKATPQDATNKLFTNTPIVNGDNLVLVKADNSIHSITASGVTGTAPYQMDTTSVTNGEIPAKVYKVTDSIEFNGVVSTPTLDSYTESAGVLSLDRTFSDIEIPQDTQVIPKVNLSAIGNKLKELSFDLYN